MHEYMENEALVSVIIPTYNRDKTLLRAVNSVLKQTYKNTEIILVDDNSTDNTYGIIKTIQDSRVKYYKCEINLGPSGARNFGITKSKGKYIAFQDSDDEWDLNKLEKQMNIITDKHRNIDMVYTGYYLIYGSAKHVYIPSTRKEDRKSGDIFFSLLDYNTIGTPTILLKKECMNNVGMFNEEIKSYEDWELSLRVAREYRIAFIDEPLVNAWYSKSGVNSNNIEKIKTVCYIMIKYKDTFMLENVQEYEKFIRKKMALLLSLIFDMEDKKIGIALIKNLLVPDIIKEYITIDLVIEQYKKTLKFRKYYELTSNILLLEDKNMFERYFEQHGYNRIAIYGFGILGEILFKMVKGSKIKVMYGIDNEIKCDMDIKIYSIDDKLEKVDAIIVTAVFAFEEIEKRLERTVLCPIISLENIISDINK